MHLIRLLRVALTRIGRKIDEPVKVQVVVVGVGYQDRGQPDVMWVMWKHFLQIWFETIYPYFGSSSTVQAASRYLAGPGQKEDISGTFFPPKRADIYMRAVQR
jgi:hypothetical protein